jgi:hypothetical protein
VKKRKGLGGGEICMLESKFDAKHSMSLPLKDNCKNAIDLIN